LTEQDVPDKASVYPWGTGKSVSGVTVLKAFTFGKGAFDGAEELFDGSFISIVASFDSSQFLISDVELVISGQYLALPATPPCLIV
jgi:hypothetical protein